MNKDIPYYKIVVKKILESETEEEIERIVVDYAAGAILDSKIQKEIYEKGL